MKKSVKKLGKYYLYRESIQFKDEICLILNGVKIESTLPVLIEEINRKRSKL